MIHMTHHGNDGIAWLQIVFIVLFLMNRLGDRRTDILRLKTILFSYQVNGFRIQALVDTDHHTDTHASADNLGYRYVHHTCQLIGCDKLGNLQYLVLTFLSIHPLFHSGTDEVTLLTTMLNATAKSLLLVCKTGKRFLDFLRNVFITDHLPYRLILLLFVFLIAALLVVLVLRVTVIIAFIFLFSLVVLLHLTANVNFVTLNAVALLADFILVELLLALFAFLLFGLLLRMSRHIDGRKVYTAQHFRTTDSRLSMRSEHLFWYFLLLYRLFFFRRNGLDFRLSLLFFRLCLWCWCRLRFHGLFLRFCLNLRRLFNRRSLHLRLFSFRLLRRKFLQVYLAKFFHLRLSVLRYFCLNDLLLLRRSSHNFFLFDLLLKTLGDNLLNLFFQVFVCAKLILDNLILVIR